VTYVHGFTRKSLREIIFHVTYVLKVSSVRRAGHAARMGEERNAYRILVGKPEETTKGKVKLSPYRPWRPLGLREVEAPTFSDIRLIDGGRVVSPTRRPLFTPRKIPDTHFC
jgi:hypothetical protein